MEKHGKTPTRKCIDCGLHSEDLTLFAQSKNAKYGRRNLCSPCYTKRNKENSKLKDWKTDHQTKRRYGIDRETYLKRMASSFSCEVCGSTKELCYDHDHETMAFRGVLCRACNRSIGQLGDNAEGLEKALAYLRKYKNEKETH